MDVDVWVIQAGRAEARAAVQDIVARHGRPSFSFADSGDLAVIAVAAGGAVGVDVERVRDRRGIDRIAERVLGPADRHAIAAEHGAGRVARFYRCWTAAEASAKARGEGLPALLGDRPRPRLGVTWFEPAPGYVAAVATDGETPCVRQREHP